MALSTEQNLDYLEDAEAREMVYIKQVEELYSKVLNEVTNDSLKLFNSRRYLNAADDNARARAAKKDPGIKAITGKIEKLGANTIKLINTSCIKNYNSESKHLTLIWNENTPEFFTLTATPADKKKQKEILTQYYLGFQYAGWQQSATNTAKDGWIRSSRGIMSSNVRRVGKVAPSTQMTSDLRKTITTMESKAKSLMSAALSETTRILMNDANKAALKTADSLASQLLKRAEKWL